jgi:hypothetical protein
MGRSFLQISGALLRLLRSWWRVDRVRISPREGALLRLQPPCVLEIGNHRVEVVARRETKEEQTVVVYNCNTDQGPATLRINLADQGCTTAVYWQMQGSIYQLSPADIQVYA